MLIWVSARSWVVGLSCGVMACACSHHVRMQSPHTTPGPRYVCRAEGSCHPAATDVPAERNQSGTTFVALPEQCEGRIHEIVVLDADSSEPHVDVTCAPKEEPIETMGEE